MNLAGETFYAQIAAQKGVSLDGVAAAAWPLWIIHGVDGTSRATAGTDAVTVREDANRWVVDCPFCASAQVAAETDPRFLCTDCQNATVSGLFVNVGWPT